MSGLAKSIFGGGDNGAAQRNAQGSALAAQLQREGEVNRELGADGGPRRRRGRQLLAFLGDENGQASLN